MKNENSFSHLNEHGHAHMVDVANREITKRIASATAFVALSPQVIAALRENSVPKGDVLGVARIAGIMGAKKTSELIPLCHPLPIHGVEIDLKIEDEGVLVAVEIKTVDRTGVEMEALTAASIASLTIIDMTKSMDPYGVISNIRLEHKSGGRNGTWNRNQ